MCHFQLRVFRASQTISDLNHLWSFTYLSSYRLHLLALVLHLCQAGLHSEDGPQGEPPCITNWLFLTQCWVAMKLFCTSQSWQQYGHSHNQLSSLRIPLSLMKASTTLRRIAIGRMEFSYPRTQRGVEEKKWRISSSHPKIAVSQVFFIMTQSYKFRNPSLLNFPKNFTRSLCPMYSLSYCTYYDVLHW